MRHTHAEWAPGQDDHARALSARGQEEARRLGSWLKKSGHVPGHALVSDAKRTRQSFAALALTCGADEMADLYLAESTFLRAAIQATSQSDSLLLLAITPALLRWPVPWLKHRRIILHFTHIRRVPRLC